MNVNIYIILDRVRAWKRLEWVETSVAHYWCILLDFHKHPLLYTVTAENGCLLLRALVSFVNFVLSGAVKQSVCPIFFGANLIAFNKKEGGVCPIAVGNTLRRLVAKCAGLLVRNEMSELLVPFKLDYGVKGGVEAAVHGARLFLKICNVARSCWSLTSGMPSITSEGIRCWKQ